MRRGRAPRPSSWTTTSPLYDDVGQLLILLNTGATKVWELCDGGATVDDIVHALAEAHPDESALIAQDVRQTVRKLAELGLVVRATRTPQRAQPDAGGDGVAVRATGCGG